ncbi:multicopper oxidase family protein [Myxococcota bacterium]|nr:multicopper oxidase family protein [Myxococcota bacterium]
MTLALALALLACTDDKPADDSGQPPLDGGSTADGGTAGDGGTTLPPAEPEPCTWSPAPDLDPSDEVVEIDLTAAPHAWDPGTGVLLDNGLAYGGQVPGPIIEVSRGQTLRVNFQNDLDHDTTVHWHGLRVPDAMDGAVRMADMVMAGHGFTYELPMVDTGFYWYHPHMATEDVLERGLYGTIVSRHPDEPRVGCDIPLVLDDILLDEDTWQIAPEDTEHMQLMGRLGNLLMANGRAGRRFLVPSGQPVLLRLVNASNARFWSLSLPDHTFSLLATDGGWLSAPVELETVPLAPGERVIVAVTLQGEVGDELTVMNARVQLHAEDAHMVEYDPMGEGENPVFSFIIEEQGEPGEPLSLPADDAPALADPGTTAHAWVLDEQMEEGIVTIDGASYPDVPLVTVEGPALTAFEVHNDSEMHHPFHLHGNRFQVLSVDGEAPLYAGWKDTFDIPPYARVRFVSELDNPGEWMYHCHILEHAELGMAGFFTVTPAE